MARVPDSRSPRSRARGRGWPRARHVDGGCPRARPGGRNRSRHVNWSATITRPARPGSGRRFSSVLLQRYPARDHAVGPRGESAGHRGPVDAQRPAPADPRALEVCDPRPGAGVEDERQFVHELALALDDLVGTEVHRAVSRRPRHLVDDHFVVAGGVRDEIHAHRSTAPCAGDRRRILGGRLRGAEGDREERTDRCAGGGESVTSGHDQEFTRTRAPRATAEARPCRIPGGCCTMANVPGVCMAARSLCGPVLALSLALVCAGLLSAQVPPPPEGAPMTPALARLMADKDVKAILAGFLYAEGPLWR